MEEINQKLKSRVKQRRHLLNTEGKKVFAMVPESSPNIILPWYDPIKFRHAQRLFNNYGILIYISQLYGILLTFKVHHIVAPLFATPEHRTIAKLAGRYSSTIVFVRNWFTYDPFDPQSKSHQSLKSIRGFHRKFGEKFNRLAKLDQNDEDSIWFSQHLICHGICLFMGMMTIFPKELGFHRFRKYDFECMFHFWRVIGYCLGVDDRFNVCAGSYEEVVEHCQQIYFDDWLHEIGTSSPKTNATRLGVETGKGLCMAMNFMVPLLSYNAMLRYASPFIKLNKQDYPITGFRERLSYSLLIVFFKLVTRSLICVWLMTKFMFVVMYFGAKFRNVMLTELETMYDDKVRYELDGREKIDVKIYYKSVFDLKLD